VQAPLTAEELCDLIRNVFSPKSNDKRLAILLDVPDETVRDNDAWRKRRLMAREWAQMLDSVKESLKLESVDLILYPNVHSNNADLPETAYLFDGSAETVDANTLTRGGKPMSFEKILAEHPLVLAPTEFSTTAPLKLLSTKLRFRAATMPGFSQDMIPALRLDYGLINRRVTLIKHELDPAVGMDIQFTVKEDRSYKIHFDLRYRAAHVSGGRFPEPGAAGNLPSGECYIVPYEGEKKENSESRGTLPVQFEEEVVLYRIERNKAVDILSKGPYSEKEKEYIKAEPAYANIAELGFGVLGDFGIKPIGEILLDEKLGLHIAFGRSDHFGGAVGVKDFSSPEKVVHIDRIYIPETQSKVQADWVKLIFRDKTSRTLMKKGVYTLFD
jgi:hypothetical protein